MPLQIEFATKEFTARTMWVLPSRFGPPESPKQEPPLLECSLMNSSPLVEEVALAGDRLKTTRTRHGRLGSPLQTR